MLPALAAAFAKKKKEYTGFKIALILELIALLMPLSGFIMSGFSAINNRWTFVIAFTVSFATASVLEDFTSLTKAQCISMIFINVFYGIVFFLTVPGNIELLYTFLLLTVSTGLFLYFARSAKRKRCQIYPVFFLMTVLSIAFHGVYLYGNTISPYSKEFAENGAATENITLSPFNRFANLEEEEFYRIDSNQINSTKENLPLSIGYNGVSLYNSVIDGSIVSYHRDLSNIGISAVHRIWSLDGRTGLEALANVKYYMTNTGQEAYVPYGFTKESALSDNTYDVYQNDYLLPLGYTYDSCIAYSKYESLTALERQQIMMESVALDDDAAVSSGLPEHNRNTGISFSYEKRAGYEAYVHLGGFERNIYLNTIAISTSGMTKFLSLRGKNKDYSLCLKRLRPSGRCSLG